MILAVAFPSKGICDPSFVVAIRMLDIQKPFDRLQTVYVPGADVSVARNLLAEKAGGDYIFFVDDDVLPPINTITKLYEHKKDIISGLYFAKQEPHFPQIFKRNKDGIRYDAIYDYPQDQLVEVDSCGAGCMLIKKEVFKKLKQPFFQYRPKSETEPRKGEDFYFCEKARKAGYKIYCDTSIICKHIKTAFVGPQHWEISKEKIEELKKKMGPEEFEKFKKSMYD